MTAPRLNLVLASTSQYRAQLLRRLHIEFEQADPGVDEAHQAGELPAERARRLSAAKASSLATQFPSALLIGSDQVAAFGEQILDKPGSRDAAIESLRLVRGQSVNFYTGVTVLNTDTGETDNHLDITCVHVRGDLTDEDIERYVDADQPLDCAGSFKVESLGIGLFDSVSSKDPTALIGLPLIAVAKALRSFGTRVP